MPLRDVSEPPYSEHLYPAVCETVDALDLDPGGRDAAAVKLAKQYARTIDEADPGKAYASAIRWIGPELQRVLEALGATPAARAALTRTTPQAPAQESKLDQLRAARQKRA